MFVNSASVRDLVSLIKATLENAMGSSARRNGRTASGGAFYKLGRSPSETKRERTRSRRGQITEEFKYEEKNEV